MASPSIDTIDQTIVRFNTLEHQEQNELFTRDGMVRFSKAAKDVYTWNCAMMDKGRNEFSVPAMLIPAILGMQYKQRDSQVDFIKNFLKVHGQEGVDWKIFKKNEMNFIHGNESVNEFKAPNAVDRVIKFSRDDHHNTKYPVVTPHFARVLIMRSTASLGRELADFYTVIHDELRAYLQGKQSTLQPVIEQQVSERVKRARDALDETNLECEQQCSKERRLMDHIGNMKELFGWDERDRIYYKDQFRAIVAPKEGVVAAIENGGRGSEISIAMVCQEMGVNPRGKSPQIGREMAKRWRASHPEELIPRREVIYQGRPYMENTYYKRDTEMMKDVIRHVMGL